MLRSYSKIGSHVCLRRASTLIIICALVGITGCDIDLFGLTSRNVVGDYDLHETDESNYYLDCFCHDSGGTNHMQWPVDSLGWSSNYLVVIRDASYRGTHRWTVINIHTHEVQDWVTDEEFRRQFPHPVVYSGQQAWDQL
jgi:hypothetical protein